jgi:hypothetical protein
MSHPLRTTIIAPSVRIPAKSQTLALYRITVESSLAATLAAVGFMINYCICGSDNLFMLFWEMFHPKLYVIPFIAVLNSRLDLQRGFTSNGVSADSVSSRRVSSHRSSLG